MSESLSYKLFCLFVCDGVKRLFNSVSAILRLYPHETSYNAATLKRSCHTCRHMTRATHPSLSHYQLAPGRPAIFPSTHLLMPSVSNGATGTIFLRLLVCRGQGSNPQPSIPKADTLYHLTICLYD